MSLREDIQGHFLHYLALIVILNLGVGFFWFWRFNPLNQTIVVLATSGAYVVWGLIHHWLEEDLHLKVVVEYLLIALLSDLVLLSLLLRA